MAVTFGQIITDALVEINANSGPDVATADLQLGLTRGNAFLDSINGSSLMQYVRRLDSFPFVTSKQIYTIGRSGTADFVADRPTEILQASIVLTGANPNVYIPLYIANSEEWANIYVLNFSTSIPAIMWYEPTFPDGRIHLRGIPSTTSYELRILTSQQFNQAATLATQFVFPPGGYEMFMYSLAERLCNPFGKTGEVVARIQRMARDARANFKSGNSEPARIQLDGLGPRGMGPYWNWLDSSLVYR